MQRVQVFAEFYGVFECMHVNSFDRPPPASTCMINTPAEMPSSLPLT